MNASDVKVPSGRFAGASVTDTLDRLEDALAGTRRARNGLYDVICAIEAVDPSAPDAAERMRALAAGAAADFAPTRRQVTPGRLDRMLRRQDERAAELADTV